MTNEGVRSGLNDNHKRALSAGISSIEKLLSEVEAACAATKTQSVLARLVPDLSPVQTQVVARSVAQLRSRLAEVVRELDLPTGEALLTASRVIETSLLFSQNTIDELSPSRLRGYGEIGPDAAATLEALNADLSRKIEHLRTYLRQGRGRDLSAES